MKLFGDRKDRRRLPLFPLKDNVLFPGVSAPLVVRDEEARRVVHAAWEADRTLVMVPRREPASSDYASVGTVAHLHHLAKTPDGSVRIVAEGRDRVSVDEIHTAEEVPSARCTPVMPDRNDPEERLATLIPVARQTLAEFLRLHPAAGPRIGERINAAEGADRFVDLAAGNLPLEHVTRLALLAEPRTIERVSRLTDALQHQVELLSMKRSIRERVRKRLESGQKEYFLQEQLKEIHKELGHDGSEEPYAELERRIADDELPEPVRTRAERELGRLKRLPAVSPESGIIQTYLDWLTALPWNRVQPDPPELSEAREILDADHYAMEEPKDRLLEFMAVQSLNPDLKAPILCLVGPPGTGKTSLGRSTARALNREFVRLSLGGIRDEAEIRGHRRTYVGALPGRIIQAIRRAGVHNPVLLLDEIDKLGADFRGDPAGALLEVLDPEQNGTFSDHYIELDFDLSQVIFLTTANDITGIPHALRDRLEVIAVPGYTEEEKLHIARRFLVPEQLRENGLKDNPVTFRRDALRTLIRDYTAESGVRSLKRRVAAVIRKLVRERVEHQTHPDKEPQKTVTAGTVQRLLGAPPFRSESPTTESRVGLARGLAWTERGGLVLSVEAVAYDGGGTLTLTGNLGEVMRESARAALSLIRARATVLEVVHSPTEKDTHVHVPQGAVPKDGPSAGLTMFAALLSLFTDRPVASGIAMTGEVTLTGRVLAVGGVREKVLAARREGLTTVILPVGNTRDVDELPPEARRGMTFHAVESVDEAIPLLFCHDREQPGAARRPGVDSEDGS